MSRARIVVLASGGGSNLGALLTHLEALGQRRQAEVAAVASDRTAAGALERARGRGIEAVRLQTSTAPDGEPLGACLDRIGADLVVLAGYLRLIPGDVVRRYHGRMLNVHPALLPAFGGPGMYGQRVHQAVLDAGVRVSGATVHFVDEVFDHGAVLAQWPVPVLEGDTAGSLAARVLRTEHALYPRVVHAVAAGEAELGSDGRARWTQPPPCPSPVFALAESALDHPADFTTMDLLYPNP